MRNPKEDARTVGRLKRRADFLHVGKGRRWHGRALSLQANVFRSESSEASEPRIGFTLTRKVGCAVVRNRARRRLKEAARLSGDLPLKAGHDYVVVGRLEAIRIPFASLKIELAAAVRGVHETRAASRRSGKPRKEIVQTP